MLHLALIYFHGFCSKFCVIVFSYTTVIFLVKRKKSKDFKAYIENGCPSFNLTMVIKLSSTKIQKFRPTVLVVAFQQSASQQVHLHRSFHM